MKYTDKMQSIRENPIYQEMIGWYNDSVSQYEQMPKGLEGTDKAAHTLLTNAYFAVGRALDAVIDAHVAQQAVVAMQSHQKHSVCVPISTLAGLMGHIPYHQALSAYRAAWEALPQDGKDHTPEQMQALDAACEASEQGVIAAVQTYARQYSAYLQGQRTNPEDDPNPELA